MRLKDTTKLSTRMFKARTSRTLLTILGMGVGMAAILFLVALGFGIQRELMKTISTADSLLSLDVYPEKTDEMIDSEEISKIKSLEGVDLISPLYNTKVQARYDGVSSDAGAVVVDKYYLNLNGTGILRGSGLNDENAEGLVISSTFAKLFNRSASDMIGGTLRLSIAVPENEANPAKMKTVDPDKDFKVIGVVDSKENIIYINSAGLENIVPVSQFSSLKIKCRTDLDVEKVKNSIGSSGFIVSSVSDTVKQMDQFFAIVRIILGFFGMIALLVSSIGMFNTMTVALLERTEEIGIMKAIGAYNRDILAMFVLESTIMGFLGGICGIALGILGAKLFNLLVNLIAQKMGGNPISLFSFPLWFLAFILLSSTIVGFLTGVIPAKRASSTDPLDALRYK
jgi:putative ABC transport system permease protein